MSANALIQARIDRDIKEKATEVLGSMGLTVSDAVRILLTRTANVALPFATILTLVTTTRGSKRGSRRRLPTRGSISTTAMWKPSSPLVGRLP